MAYTGVKIPWSEWQKVRAKGMSLREWQEIRARLLGKLESDQSDRDAARARAEALLVEIARAEQ